MMPLIVRCNLHLVIGFQGKKMLLIARCTLDLLTGFHEKKIKIEITAEWSFFITEY
jgi:hypothetical protein